MQKFDEGTRLGEQRSLRIHICGVVVRRPNLDDMRPDLRVCSVFRIELRGDQPFSTVLTYKCERQPDIPEEALRNITTPDIGHPAVHAERQQGCPQAHVNVQRCLSVVRHKCTRRNDQWPFTTLANPASPNPVKG